VIDFAWRLVVLVTLGLLVVFLIGWLLGFGLELVVAAAQERPINRDELLVAPTRIDGMHAVARRKSVRSSSLTTDTTLCLDDCPAGGE
jgi:hypothetical protein